MVHTPLWQSLPAAHILPAAQGGQLGPPQSTSVSVPSLIPFVQLVLHVPLVQLWPLGQTLPQAPQLLGLVCRLMHTPLQSVSPVGQDAQVLPQLDWASPTQTLSQEVVQQYVSLAQTVVAQALQPG